MKIGPLTISFESIGIGKPTALDAGRAKGLFQNSDAVQYKPEQINDLFLAYENSDLIRAPIDDLVESACGNGEHYNTVKTVTPVLNKSKSRDLANAFCDKFVLDSMLPNIERLALIAGFCPVESIITDDLDSCYLKIVHPKTVDKIEADPILGTVTSIHQKVDSEERTLKGERLAWFTYGKVGNDPRGTSLVKGIVPLLNFLNKANLDVGLILDRYIAPIGIWKTKQDKEIVQKAVTERAAGEDIFLGRMTTDELNAKIVEFVNIDPRVPFWEYIQDMKAQIFAYMRASNLWYEKDATLASDTALEQIIGRHIKSIQRDIRLTVEKSWYKPYITLVLGEDAEIPQLNFGKEPTGVGDIEPSMIITKGLDLGYITQHRFDAIMKQIGIKLPEEEEEQEEEGIEEPEEKDKQDETNLENGNPETENKQKEEKQQNDNNPKQKNA